MYHYVRNAYVGWRKGVPSELYWPCLWADTKCVLFAGSLTALSAPITIPFFVLYIIAAALTKLVEVYVEGIGWLGEATGARRKMDALNYARAQKMKPVREWHRANRSMRYTKIENNRP